MMIDDPAKARDSWCAAYVAVRAILAEAAELLQYGRSTYIPGCRGDTEWGERKDKVLKDALQYAVSEESRAPSSAEQTGKLTP